MKININDWVFDVNKDETENYYKSNELCDCTPCQNYYAIIKSQYPKLNDFLLQFGVDIERPEETIWYENDIDQTVLYDEVWYPVNGIVDNIGQSSITIEELEITLFGVYPNTKMAEPYFMFEVHNIILPWKHCEDFNKVFPQEQKKTRLLKKCCFLNKEEREKIEIEQWKKIRSLGKKKFTWTYGVLKWGLYMGISMAIVFQIIEVINFHSFSFLDFIKRLLISLVIFSIGGYIYSSILWRINERKYNNINCSKSKLSG